MEISRTDGRSSTISEDPPRSRSGDCRAGGGRRSIAALLVATLLAAGLAACGSSGSPASSSSNAASTGSGGGSSSSSSSGGTVAAPHVYAGPTSIDPSYEGSDKKWLTTLPQPKKTGHPFKVGYIQINGSIPTLEAEQKAAAAEVAALGGTLIVKDGDGSIGQQVAGFNQLLTQGANAIIAYPVVAGALATGFRAAAAKHIPVILLGQQTSSSPPDVPGTVTDVDQSVDYSVYETMKGLAARLPKGATFAIISIAPPVATLRYLGAREIYWGQKFGLKYSGEVPTGPDIAGLTVSSKTMITKFPDAQAYVAINDYSAAAISNAQRIAGNTKSLVVTANGGDPISVPLIKAGREAIAYRVAWEEMGVQAAIAAYDQETSQHLPVPKLIQTAGVAVTKANVDAVPFAQ